MVRSALGKVAWVGRTASMVFGLALVMALVLGVATMAFGANGDFFKVGKKNVATLVSTLVRKGPGPALSLKVKPGQPPMAVNSATKVANLNADQLDGREAPLWAVVNANGSTARGAGVVSSTNNTHLGSAPGNYTVTFNRNVSSCAYIASLGGTQAGELGQVTAYGNGGNANAVNVITSDSAGNQEPAKSFHLAVLC